jgi:DNA-binding transcriptional ArsR family regulator
MTTGGPELAHFAALFADSTRASFLITLLDGRARTASELARIAGVAPSTASDHLTQLVAGGLLAEERQGRWRYVRLSGHRAAHLVEEMQALAAPARSATTLRDNTAYTAMARARTCYDHVAGRLGVQLADALVGSGLVDRAGGPALTRSGLTWLADLGADVPALQRAQRPMLRDCLDWTERRPHLAGSVGAAMCAYFFDAGWIERIGSQRAVRITADGQRRFAELGVTV